MTGREARDRHWAELLTRANAGDRAAYAAFLRDVTPVLERIIAARSRALPEEGDDIVQETLMAIHAKRHTWKAGAPVAPWLYAIARHKAADAWRRRGGRSTVPVEDVEAELLAEEGDPTAAGDLDRLMADLDPRSAEIVRRIGIEGGSARETGDEMDMKEGAVRVAYHRALARLRRAAGGGQ